MTSDAKVGLLLGFAIIVGISFLINGLPEMLNGADSDELIPATAYNPNNYSSAYNDINQQAKKAVDIINAQRGINQPDPESVQIVIEAQRDVPIEQVRNRISLGGDQRAPASDQSSLVDVADRVPRIVNRPKTYKVASGDNLAKISKKVYGEERGNKLESVELIYKANMAMLTSIDDVKVGQQLVIPMLNSTVNDSGSGVQTPGVLDRAKEMISNTFRPKKLPEYVVKDGDDLWSVAEKFLGNGNRYSEIVKLNKNVIADPEDISVGMRLRLPGN